MKKLKRFLRSEERPTAVEYAVMLALILLACLAAVTLVGSATSSSFNNSNSAIEAAIGSQDVPTGSTPGRLNQVSIPAHKRFHREIFR